MSAWKKAGVERSDAGRGGGGENRAEEQIVQVSSQKAVRLEPLLEHIHAHSIQNDLNNVLGLRSNDVDLVGDLVN